HPGLRGDCNCDGVVDASDATALAFAVQQGQSAWEARYPCAFFAAADLNQDSRVPSQTSANKKLCILRETERPPAP
ncbi:MAG TPA: hypothetical protein PKN93_16795, partial [Leptospiraceae bacterium]|nr:hypothetical protein [Leptospiraceae bacterium]